MIQGIAYLKDLCDKVHNLTDGVNWGSLSGRNNSITMYSESGAGGFRKSSRIGTQRLSGSCDNSGDAKYPLLLVSGFKANCGIILVVSASIT